MKLLDDNVICVSCLKCFLGLGIIVFCGSIVLYNVFIECKVCMFEYYFDLFFLESCKFCFVCMLDEVIVVKCIKIFNICCNCKFCLVGYYYN